MVENHSIARTEFGDKLCLTQNITFTVILIVYSLYNIT